MDIPIGADSREVLPLNRPLPLLPEIREVLPDDGILSVDVHGIGYASFAEYPVLNPKNLPLSKYRCRAWLRFPCGTRREDCKSGQAGGVLQRGWWIHDGIA